MNIVLLLANGGRAGDALLYARAALHHFERVGLGATQGAAEPRDLIALLERQEGLLHVVCKRICARGAH